MTYKNDEDASSAITEMNDQDFDGRRIRVDRASERREGGGGGGFRRQGGNGGGYASRRPYDREGGNGGGYRSGGDRDGGSYRSYERSERY